MARSLLEEVIDRVYAAAGMPFEPSFLCGLVSPLVAPAEIVVWANGSDSRIRGADPSRRLSAWVIEDGPGAAFVGAVRAGGAPPFKKAEAALFHAVVPHLRRVLALRQELAGAEQRSRQGRQALDRLAAAVVLLDGRGKVLLANRRAREILDTGEALAIEEGRLRAAGDRQHCELEAAITGATTDRRRPAPFGAALLLTRPNGRAPLAALFLPSRPRLGWMAELSPAAVLVLADPMRDEIPEGVLHELYGLTRAEAAMMQALLSGEGLPRAAARLGISPNTAKAHLAQILGKTEAGGQSGLIRLVYGGPGMVCWG